MLQSAGPFIAALARPNWRENADCFISCSRHRNKRVHACPCDIKSLKPNCRFAHMWFRDDVYSCFPSAGNRQNLLVSANSPG